MDAIIKIQTCQCSPGKTYKNINQHFKSQRHIAWAEKNQLHHLQQENVRLNIQLQQKNMECEHWKSEYFRLKHIMSLNASHD